jgi:glutamate-ammonia-ligase adenylyltransferase
MARWPSYPAFRSPRAARIFDQLRPEFLARLAKVSRPDEALLALDGFLAGLPAGVQLFSLFQANPQLIDLLIDITGTSPALAAYLSRNASVFDAVIGGDFFSAWPGADDLAGQLSEALEREADYENRLDMARRWTKDWHFRIGVHHLRGLIGALDAASHYADLADAVVRALWPVVTAEFARKHGAPPGRGAAILGMGSLGAQRLHSASDLDVIVIYDPAGVESSEGKRPLAARAYYARLTQAMITAMSARMANGRLYEIDMRLRPSGNQGPVATSLPAFRNYQQTEAWTWEHLALTRARCIAGPLDLMNEIEAFRCEILQASRESGKVLDAVADMRARIEAAHAPSGVWDVKTGPGRMQDVELLAQAGSLLSGAPSRSVRGGLAGAQRAGLVSRADAVALGRAYRLLW